MFFLSEPTERAAQRFLRAQKSTRFSYPHVGQSRVGGSPAGYVVDHNRIQLGSGIETFERAKMAVREDVCDAMNGCSCAGRMLRSASALT
jgi:Domain of unknown function (DUF1990)